MKLPSNVYAAVGTYGRALCIALNIRDAYTLTHSARVCALATELGKRCRLSQIELDTLNFSAVLHDVGKLGIPDGVLLKPDVLNVEERAIMRTHAEIGQKIILGTDWPEVELAGTTVRHHHECFDGSGYPDGLRGEEIPVLARILTLADRYDAMASARIYHSEKTHRQILDIMDDENAHFDPYLQNIFNRVMESGEFRYRDPDSQMMANVKQMTVPNG